VLYIYYIFSCSRDLLMYVTANMCEHTVNTMYFGQSLDTPFKVIQGRWIWYQSKERNAPPYLAPFRR